jgi:hypothetical protein
MSDRTWRPREETCVTLTITIRLPALPLLSWAAPVTGSANGAGAAGPAGHLAMLRFVRSVLPLIEPAAVLIADAAGLGLAGQIMWVTALRYLRQALSA